MTSSFFSSVTTPFFFSVTTISFSVTACSSITTSLCSSPHVTIHIYSRRRSCKVNWRPVPVSINIQQGTFFSSTYHSQGHPQPALFTRLCLTLVNCLAQLGLLTSRHPLTLTQSHFLLAASRSSLIQWRLVPSQIIFRATSILISTIQPCLDQGLERPDQGLPRRLVVHLDPHDALQVWFDPKEFEQH